MAPRKQARAPPPPARLPAGLLLTDVSRHTWRLGTTIGCGGFGAIYTATSESPSAPASGSGYVVKIEPHANGPLFSEMHCYHRVARAETIVAWQRRRKLARLGMPRFIGNGSVEHAGEKYRFMVMERFGSDLQSILDKNGNKFPLPTILHIGIQVLDVLEYLHDQEYVHGDVKAQNLLVGLEKGTENQIYLVDFGLACRYATEGRHKPYKPDPKKAHNGTIEFASRDAHVGVQSRRADLEVLGYNMLQWAAGRLPWQDNLTNVETVAKRKRESMENVPALTKACFPAGVPAGADAIGQFLSAAAALPFEAVPDYDALRAILRAALKTLGCSGPPQLRFTKSKSTTPSKSRSAVRDRSPLSPLQPPLGPSTSGRRQGAARKGRARRRRDPDDDGEDATEEGESEEEVVKGGRGKGTGKRAKQTASGARKKAPPSSAASSASVSTTSSIYDNMTPSMQAVLARKAAAGALKPTGKGRGRTAKPSTVTSRRVATVHSHRPAAVSAALSDSDDAAESFHTPPTSEQRRRSGRHAGVICQTSPAAGAYTPEVNGGRWGATSPAANGGRRLRSGNSFSPEL